MSKNQILKVRHENSYPKEKPRILNLQRKKEETIKLTKKLKSMNLYKKIKIRKRMNHKIRKEKKIVIYQ